MFYGQIYVKTFAKTVPEVSLLLSVNIGEIIEIKADSTILRSIFIFQKFSGNKNVSDVINKKLFHSIRKNK